MLLRNGCTNHIDDGVPIDDGFFPSLSDVGWYPSTFHNSELVKLLTALSFPYLYSPRILYTTTYYKTIIISLFYYQKK